MGLIEYYLLFALSTSITSWYIWYKPLVRKARETNIKNSFTEYGKLSSIVYIIVSSIIAPVIVLPLLSSQFAENFERGLAKEILKNEV
jgi:nicotinamide riboside transporter PnuC